METVNFVKEELKRDHETVGTDTLNHFQFMIGNFLLPETEDTFLSLVCHLLLGRTESNPGGAETLIFKEPLDKLKSDFKPMNINPSWRSQYDLNVNMPKFAETLSSSMSSQGSSSQSMMSTMIPMQIRATQQGPLEFMPTMMSTMSQQNSNVGQSFGPSWTPSSMSQSVASFMPGQFKVSNADGFGSTKNSHSPTKPIGSGYLAGKKCALNK